MTAIINDYHGTYKELMEAARDGYKFQENGLWGLKAQDGTILFPPKYDQLEICADYVWAHYGNRYKYFYYNGSTTEGPDDDDDLRFYQDGKIGLRHSDGSILLPPIYDKIIDWGTDCDVIYTRVGKEFHYYNHAKEEILTKVDNIPEDAYPTCPYNLGEDQKRHVLLCVEPAPAQKGEDCCYAYGQWVRLSRIPSKDIAQIFASCSIVPMPATAIRDFYSDDTYIYSARYCKANGATPIADCLETLKSFDIYDTSWRYLVKVAINHNTLLDPHDLYTLVKHFEDIEHDDCIDYHICIGYDTTLADGEVSIFQVHYFSDDGGAFLYNTLYQSILPHGTLEEVIDGINHSSTREDDIRTAYYWMTYSESRPWSETRKILDWLYAQGAADTKYIVARNASFNHCWIEEISDKEWTYRSRMLTWAVSHGANINLIQNGRTIADNLLYDIEIAREIDREQENEHHIKKAEHLHQHIVLLGGKTTAEQRAFIVGRISGLSPAALFDVAYK